MTQSAVILCGFLLAGFAAPTMAKTVQTEAMKRTVLPQEEQQMVQRMLNNTELDQNDTLSGSPNSNTENLTGSDWIVPSRPKQIPPGYKFRKGLGYYKIHTVRADFSNAMAACEREGAHLVILNSKEEAMSVIDLKIEMNLEDADNGILLGIHDLLVERKYITIFGQPLTETGYAEWNGGQPDDKEGSQDCIILRLNRKFNDIPCHKKWLFACELWQQTESNNTKP